MKLRIGKPALAPQADEPIAPLQKSIGPSPFSKLLRAANDEPRVAAAKPQASTGLPANDPAREVPLLTVAHGPLQPPPNPGRRATDLVKAPSAERGLVERLRVVSEPKAEPLAVMRSESRPQPTGRRANDQKPPAAEAGQATKRVEALEATGVASQLPVEERSLPVSSASMESHSPSRPAPAATGEVIAAGNLLTTPTATLQPETNASSLPASHSKTRPTPSAVTASPPAHDAPPPKIERIAPAMSHAVPTKQSPTIATGPIAGELEHRAQPDPTHSAPPQSTSHLPAHTNHVDSRAQPPQAIAARPHAVSPTVPLVPAEQSPAPATRPSSAPAKPEVAVATPREQTKPGPTVTSRAQAGRAALPNAPLTTRDEKFQPSAAPLSTPIRTQEQPSRAAPRQQLAKAPEARTSTTLTPNASNAEPGRPAATLAPTFHEFEAPRPEPKSATSTLHRRRVVDSNVQEKPPTEKSAPAQSPTAPLVTTSNTSFVAAPDRRSVARASPDTLVAPLSQDFAHRPTSIVRDEATPTPTHAPALREPPAIAATLFSVSPTVTATAVDTKHFGTAPQALKPQHATTAPMGRHAVEPGPAAPAHAPHRQVAQVLELAAHRTTKPAEPNATVGAPEQPSSRKLERVEPKKAAEPDRDDKTVGPLPTQPAPLQQTELPPPPRAVEPSTVQPPNPLPNVAPAYLDDPTLRVVVLPNIARLNVETQDSGTLSLQVKVHDGVTDIRAAGPAASLVEARQGELRLALAHEGLALGHFDLTQSDHQGAPQHRFEPHDEREPLPRRTHVRAETSSSSTTRAEGRLSVKA